MKEFPGGARDFYLYHYVYAFSVPILISRR
jgi:hypothetical protein